MTVSELFRPSTVVLALSIAGAVSIHAAPRAVQAQSAPTSLAARIDPYTPKVRVLVLTDIANEPDDQMSLVRFLVYSNQFDVEGLVATTSTWMRNKVRPDVIRTLIDAYAQVQPNLSKHHGGFPTAASLRDVVKRASPVLAWPPWELGRHLREPTQSSERTTQLTIDRCGSPSGAEQTRSPRRCFRFVKQGGTT